MNVGKINFSGNIKFSSQSNVSSKPSKDNDSPAMIKYGFPSLPEQKQIPQNEDNPPCLKYAIPKNTDKKIPLFFPIYPKYGYPDINISDGDK